MNMKKLTYLLILSCGCHLVAMRSALAQAPTQKTFYFLRHAEDQEFLLETGNEGRALLADCRPFLNAAGVIELCCTEVLDSLGTKRAELLAKWFGEQGLLPTVTHVFATHKIRTLQTVQPIAHAAGLDPDLNGDGKPDGTDMDLISGDGVQQIPAVQECERGYEIAHEFFGLTVAALQSLPLGTGAVVCGHSASIYPIMESFGINTSDPKKFPKTAVGRVRGFNNLWIVSVDANNVGTLASHIQLDFGFVQKITP